MEKEISIEVEGFFINFFYDEFELTSDEESEYRESLNLLARSFSEFKDSTLLLEKFSFNLNLTICSDIKIKELNNEYRQKNKITDVLSFPLQESIRSGDFDKFCPEIELGDLYICKSVCSSQAKEFSLSYQDEFIHLSTHGFLHVCGYDHETSDIEEKLMEKYEETIIKSISKYK